MHKHAEHIDMGWEKDKAAKWNMKAQMNCADKFNGTSRVFIQNSLENRRGMGQAPHLIPEESNEVNKITNKKKTGWKIFKI